MHEVLDTTDELLQRGGAVEVRINTNQLIVVVFIRVLVCAWIVRVIHTRSQVCIVEILVLMVQSQRVANFLTRNQISPRRGVVCRRVEIGIV